MREILIKETIEKYGYDPTHLKPMSGKMIVCRIHCCGVIKDMQKSTFTQTKNSKCSSCARSDAHLNKDSGYHSDNYHKIRSEIAIRSNKNRKTKSEKFLKYLPFLESVKNGEISFTEISNILGVDDSSVCKFFHENYNLRSKFNGSLQEKQVGGHLRTMFGDITEHVRYEDGRKLESDFFVEGVGHIEYDGCGFYHLKKSDKYVDEKFKPIRLNAQAFFGGIDYLSMVIKNERIGYCSVSSPRQYNVRKIEKNKLATDMLENCHPLKSCGGSTTFGLFYFDKLIGVARFGVPTNRYDKDCLELRRFFVLDGTPKNTESYFLRQCEKSLSGKLITYIHGHERGSYLLALGWEKQPTKNIQYDLYLVDGVLINKRRMWGWAKKTGLVDKFGTTNGKKILAHLLGAKTIYHPSKIKFVKDLS